jgi:hypothetical protein
MLILFHLSKDAHERREELHLITFDTSKAFDSPTRYSGMYLAWRRLGLNHQHASYFTKCDANNLIIPRTTHTLLHPGSSKGIHAECGTPQGDSLAGFQWRAVVDIAITILKKGYLQIPRLQRLTQRNRTSHLRRRHDNNIKIGRRMYEDTTASEHHSKGT